MHIGQFGIEGRAKITVHFGKETQTAIEMKPFSRLANRRFIESYYADRSMADVPFPPPDGVAILTFWDRGEI